MKILPKIKLTLFFLILNQANLLAFSVQILNDLDAAISIGKIKIKIDPEEFKGVYKDNMIFSLNTPQFKIGNLNFDDEAASQNLRHFKSYKKIYLEPFTVEMDLKFSASSQKQLKDILKDSTLYISCFVIDQNDKTCSQCFVKDLNSTLLCDSVVWDFKGFSLTNTLTYSFNSSLNAFLTTTCLTDSTVRENIFVESKEVPKDGFCFVNLLNSKIFLGIIFLMLLFSLYFFVPIKNEDFYFRFSAGIFLLLLGLCFLIKISLMRSYWPFHNKTESPEQVSRTSKSESAL
jgi:hypothetical protein